MKALYRDYRHVVQFVDVLVRQGHPGPGVEAYRQMEQKHRDAARFVHDDGIPWPVAIDDLDGSVHAAYGLLPDPTYLVGGDGRVAFYSYWTHVPTLRTAVAALLEKGGIAVIGEQRLPHPAAPLIAGWPAIARGLPQSATDIDRASGPGSAALLRGGYRLRDVAAPVLLTSRPCSRPLMAVFAGVALALMTRRWRAAGREAPRRIASGASG